jgi:D-alanyl-D-alanine-carboxypeptidase/D-alanyl-D-alanine-endopeptidase
MLAARLFRTRVLLIPLKLAMALLAIQWVAISARAAGPAHSPTEYVGIYTIDENSRFTVVADDTGKLHVRMTGQPFFPVANVAEDRFVLTGGAAELQFSRTNGKVSDMTLSQGGDDINASRIDAAVPVVIFPDPETLVDYVGKYQFSTGVQFEVTLKARALWVRFTGQAIYPVYADKPDHFVYDVVDASVTFERDAKGGVNGLTLHRNGTDQHATRLP